MILVKPVVRVFDVIGNVVAENKYIPITVDDLPSIVRHIKEKHPKAVRIVVDMDL